MTIPIRPGIVLGAPNKPHWDTSAGRVAYEAYMQAAQLTSVPWDELSEGMQTAWCVAAAAVIGMVKG